MSFLSRILGDVLILMQTFRCAFLCKFQAGSGRVTICNTEESDFFEPKKKYPSMICLLLLCSQRVLDQNSAGKMVLFVVYS